MIEPYLVERGSSEWDRMWSELAEKEINGGDRECLHPECHEVWEYMGSDSRGHGFRHRMHPVTGKREDLRISAD